MLFIVIKEFEPQDPHAYFNETVVDNTVRVFFRQETRDFQIYVTRRDKSNSAFSPYKVCVNSAKTVLSFLAFVFYQNSRIQLDAYHCPTIPECIENANEVTVVGYLSDYETEKYNVVGFNREDERDKSFRLIKDALRLLKNTERRVSLEETI
jgi:hypothetical protein